MNQGEHLSSIPRSRSARWWYGCRGGRERARHGRAMLAVLGCCDFQGIALMRESNSGILIGDLALALPLRYVLVLGRCHICGLLLEFLGVVVF
jgi:hypothetical protein